MVGSFFKLVFVEAGSFGAGRFPAIGAIENQIIFGAALGAYRATIPLFLAAIAKRVHDFLIKIPPVKHP